MASRVRVAVVDAQPLFRRGLSETIAGPKHMIVAEGEKADDVVGIVRQSKPDMLIIDVSTIAGDGIAATKKALKARPGLKLVILTTSDDVSDITDALQLGAQGYILKGVSGPELLGALDMINRGEPYITPTLAHKLLIQSKGKSLVVDKAAEMGLSPRDRNVLQHLGKGLKNQEIASELGVNVRTIKYYMTQIFRKMHVRSRVEAVLLARKLRLDIDTHTSS